MGLFLEDLRLNPKKFLLTDVALKVYGPEAEVYLNSQTTNNLLDVTDNSFQFNSILDLSGKIISTFILLKKSSDEFYILVQETFLNETYERIEKYHIAEDFEIEKIKQPFCLKINQEQSTGFKGQYFFESDVIELGSTPKNELEFNQLKVVTGVPELGVEVQVGELINNTFFDELTVDYAKGCYPGQETVAKINTRRGAAYKPVMLKIDGEFDIPLAKILKDDKKIGEVRNAIKYAGSTYLYALLNRENRIDNFKLEISIENQVYKSVVHYYPFISSSKESLAVDVYDKAVEYFQNNDDDSAVKYFLKAIEINPSYEDAYESLGVLYGRLEKFDKAIDLMEKLKELNPKCMMALTNLSMFHMKKGEIETAEKYKGDATLLNFQLLGDQAKDKKVLAEQEQKRQTDIARREGMFKQVLEMDETDAMANNGMGEIELDRKNYKQAASYFEAAIVGDKKYSVAYLGLAKSYYQLQMNTELKETLTSGIEIASKNGDLMPANEMQAMLLKL